MLTINKFPNLLSKLKKKKISEKKNCNLKAMRAMSIASEKEIFSKEHFNVRLPLLFNALAVFLCCVTFYNGNELDLGLLRTSYKRLYESISSQRYFSNPSDGLKSSNFYHEFNSFVLLHRLNTTPSLPPPQH